jgi:hypothetical protein
MLLTDMSYWTLILTQALSVVPFMFFCLGAGMASAVMLIIALVMYVFVAIWQAVAFIWFIILLATCNTAVECAANLSCDGTATGPYDGPTGRFIAAVVIIPVMIIIYICGVIVAANLRRPIVRAELEKKMRLFVASSNKLLWGTRKNDSDLHNAAITATEDETLLTADSLARRGAPQTNVTMAT